MKKVILFIILFITKTLFAQTKKGNFMYQCGLGISFSKDVKSLVER